MVFCKFPADPGDVEGPEEGMGLGRVEELNLCLHRPVGVASIAGLQLRHGIILQVNWKYFNTSGKGSQEHKKRDHKKCFMLTNLESDISPRG